MKKFLYIVVAFFLTSCVYAEAFEYKLYNPETKETTNARMMSFSLKQNYNTYYIGFYTYNLYCVVSKNINKNRKNIKSGLCYPIDFNSQNVDTYKKPARWKEVKPGTYDDERAEIKREYSETNMKEIEFSY